MFQNKNLLFIAFCIFISAVAGLIFYGTKHKKRLKARRSA